MNFGSEPLCFSQQWWLAMVPTFQKKKISAPINIHGQRQSHKWGLSIAAGKVKSIVCLWPSTSVSQIISMLPIMTHTELKSNSANVQSPMHNQPPSPTLPPTTPLPPPALLPFLTLPLHTSFPLYTLIVTPLYLSSVHALLTCLILLVLWPLTIYVYYRPVYLRYRTHFGLSRYLDT